MCGWVTSNNYNSHRPVGNAKRLVEIAQGKLMHTLLTSNRIHKCNEAPDNKHNKQTTCVTSNWDIDSNTIETSAH